ncbi:MAG TPA: hypothetical protein H9841_07135 [Candidatus Flavonifractor merdigallinarum]|uniref:Uncharacterized protein n=1 Tax=Candidatus Flavonifractor merdigallinarum TaxID=2838589 RepID=A0A9D1Y8R8_9FIRM|nr:hypothetical protein [Candidatus Flavonifractor merdigallinarum]
MKPQESAVEGMLRRDCILLAVFLLAALGINAFVVLETLPIVDDPGLRAGIVVVFAAAMLVLAGAMFWVGRHLFRNRTEVYGEDLHYQQLIKEQKGGGAA